MDRIGHIYKQAISNIRCDSKYARGTKISENEEKFIKALIIECDKIGMCKYLRLQRLCDNTFNVWCDCYVGKIKLQGNETYMQILKGLYDFEVVENRTFDEYLSRIPDWISYILYCK